MPVVALFIVFALVATLFTTLRRDTFQVRELYPTAPNGMTWKSQWHGHQDGWSEDPWVDTSETDGSYTSGYGELVISGATSRLYVRDPDKQRQWGNVEITVYAKRVDDGDVPYSGIVTAARTNHGMTAPLADAPCDSRGLTARLRFDGNADFGKETNHPETIATDPVPVFAGGLPHNEWIGYKHVVWDIPGGTHQELWVDLTNGLGGGEWHLVAAHDDNIGDGFGEVACAPEIDPALPLMLGARPGSESGLPNLSILFRADDIGHDGLRYRAASIREIVPPTG